MNRDYHKNELTDDALAEAFAADNDGSCLYVASREQWYNRNNDVTGASYWAPDERLIVWGAIRSFLRQVAEDPNVSGNRLGSAELVKAVEFLARSDLAGDETQLDQALIAREAERRARQ
jgi:hypothetical protein